MAISNCLGLYIEENLIKYAKVSKDHDTLKVEAFGIKFYDKIEEAINQVIQETYSQKTPISINMSQEMYQYYNMFALLTKKDLQKAVKTEFESYCADKGYNPNVFETRFAVVDNQEGKDEIRVIHIAENKIELNKQMEKVEGYKVSNITPISMAIPNLINPETKENYLVVNIEEETTVTTVLDNKVYNVEQIEEGSKDFLIKINAKENSYSKSYEICKNTTIYTSEGKELQEDQSAYLEDIMPTLFSIVEKVKKIVENYGDKIKKIFITGTAALINNIDLYFQENIEQVECEILKPHFIHAVRDISVKDYIEVNSAISLGLMGVGEGLTGINFKAPSIMENLPSWLSIDIDFGKSKEGKKAKENKLGFLTWDLGEKLSILEVNLIRTVAGLIALIVIYTIFSAVLAKQIEIKDKEAQESIDSTNKQIELANSDNSKINSKINEYDTMIKSLEEMNNKLTDRNRTRNAIPNLLNQIMSIIPENVQLTSIGNTTGTHIVISAQSDRYEQLGFLTAKIKTDVILTNVISTAGQKENSVVTITIEGDIP